MHNNLNADLSYHGRSLRPWVFNLNSEFLTRDLSLKNRLQSLSFKRTLGQIPNLVISGPNGSGKTAFAIQVWKQMQDPSRPFVSVASETVTKEKELVCLFGRARRGDLLLKNFCQFSSELIPRLQDLMRKYSVVRVIASSDNKPENIFCKSLFQELVLIPPIKNRKEDIRLVVFTLLSRRGNMTCSSQAMEIFLSQNWPEEYPQLTDCVLRSLWSARADNRQCLNASDVLQSLEQKELNFYFLENFMTSQSNFDLRQKGLKNFIKEFEAVVIAAVMAENEGNLTKTAQYLHLPINTLISRCKTLESQLEKVASSVGWKCRKYC